MAELTTRDEIIRAIQQLQGQPVAELPSTPPEEQSRRRQLATLATLSGDKPLGVVGAQTFKDVEADEARREKFAEARNLANAQRVQGMLGLLSSHDAREAQRQQSADLARERMDLARQAQADRRLIAQMVHGQGKPMQIVEGEGGQRFWADPRTGQIVAPVMLDGKPLPGKTKNLSEGAVKRLEDFGGQAEMVENFARTFKPEYGASAPIPGLGALEMRAGQRIGTNAGNWWTNYNKWVNTVRHSEFGSALTPTEVRSFEAANVTPDMPGHVIEGNLSQQSDILKRAYNRVLSTHRSANFDVSGFTPYEVGKAPAPGEVGGSYQPSGNAKRAADALGFGGAPASGALSAAERQRLNELRQRAIRERQGVTP